MLRKPTKNLAKMSLIAVLMCSLCAVPLLVPILAVALGLSVAATGYWLLGGGALLAVLLVWWWHTQKTSSGPACCGSEAP